MPKSLQFPSLSQPSSQAERISLSSVSQRFAQFTKKPIILDTADIAPIAIRSKAISPTEDLSCECDNQKKKRPLSFASTVRAEAEHPRSRQRTVPDISVHPDPDDSDSFTPRQRTSSTLTLTPATYSRSKLTIDTEAQTLAVEIPRLHTSPSSETLRAVPARRPPLIGQPKPKAPPTTSTSHTRPLSLNDVDQILNADPPTYVSSTPSSSAQPTHTHPTITPRLSSAEAEVSPSKCQATGPPPQISLKFQRQHVELWDPEPDAHYIFPAQLHLSYPLLSYDPWLPPSVSKMELSCRSLAPTGEAEYEIYYTGGTVTPTKDAGAGRAEFFLDPGRGIHIEARWRRARPGLKRKGKGRMQAQIQTMEEADVDAMTEPPASPSASPPPGDPKEGKKDPTWSWYMKFFVPIPMCMFAAGREDIMFRVRARAWVGDVDAREMCAEKEMGVSCLRWKKVLGGGDIDRDRDDE